jgi:hypothetical protein
MLKNVLFYGLSLLGAGLVLYLSWRTHPRLADVWFMPKWLSAWTDERQNDTLRTAVPFVALGWLAGGWLWAQRRPWRQWAWAWVGLVGLVSVAEIGQLFQAERSFDLADIAWGAIGALLGLGTVAALRGLRLALGRGGATSAA